MAAMSAIVVVGQSVRLPWDFATDELEDCACCGELVRYRTRRPRHGVVVCMGCFGPGAMRDDVWVLSRGLSMVMERTQ